MSAKPTAALPVAAPALLEVSGLSIVHEAQGRRRRLVQEVSLAVAEGETVGLVGESGSGKSMTALAVLGLLPPQVRASGSVRFAGGELLGQRERSLRAVRGRGISLLLQDPSTMLNPLRRCVTHGEEGLQATDGGRGRRRQEALRRLAEVGIDERAASRYPFQVSGGMAQRVGIAAALAGDPRLLIADEPSTALDVTTQREILDLLREQRERRGMSMILITHDLRVAFEVCDRVYVMYAGSVLEQAAPGDLAAWPLHPYSHGLLLSEPGLRARRARLNVIPGAVPSVDEVADRCPFSPRCRWAREICEEGRPPLVEVEPRRLSACVRVHEIRPELRTAAAAAEVEEPIVHEVERPPALLGIRELVKEFPGRDGVHRVLRGVDLAVGPGEAVGLVGESGSGKTTLARCVLGLETSTAGAISLDGIDITDYERLDSAGRRRARASVQMVFQNPYASLNPARSVGSTLAEAVRVAGAREGGVDTQVRHLLEQVRLPAGYARRRPAALSGGERQRVAIARALAVGPKLLVCDEPTSALDVSVQAQILNLLRDLQRDLQLGLLFITHNLAVVRQVTDYLYVIADGAFVEQGPTREVLDSPRHEYTQLLLASVPEGTPRPGHVPASA
jgi:peptide/nickel transport system ATP-binding protein